ncbi:MAG: threonine/serine dehydratase [Xanthomonadales bacterium]|nr:threonine/serine dehydratase [Xanthomonadales bacterium]
MRLETDSEIPQLDDLRRAHARIRKRIRQTPVLEDPGLTEAVGCTLSCKCENLQRTGAFKFRGASNAIACLRERGLAGDVATHSSGNHGAALALAAALDGRTAHVVMPDDASPLKIEAVRRCGGIVYHCEATQQGREQALERLVDQGRIPIHPYDDADIIAGQGTAALELLQTNPQLEVIITPLGGGGLVSGTAIAAAFRGVAVYGVEPEGAADTVASLERGQIVDSWLPDTIADGLRAIVGQRNFRVIREQVTKVLTVSDNEIRVAMLLFWRELRMLIEPSAATVIAAMQKYPEIFSSKRTGAIISGGNIHPAHWLELTAGK